MKRGQEAAGTGSEDMCVHRKRRHEAGTGSENIKRGHGACTGSCGMKREHVPRVTRLFLRNVFVTSPQHVAWNSAGLKSCVLKQGKMISIFNAALCAPLLQTVPTIVHVYASLYYSTCIVHTCIVHTIVHTHYIHVYASIRYVHCVVPTATCVLCVHSKGLVPNSRRYNTFSRVCWPRKLTCTAS